MTNLQSIRLSKNMSQSELAKASGISLRSIQGYESEGRDINKASGLTLFTLSEVLRCDIKDLMELDFKRTKFEVFQNIVAFNTSDKYDICLGCTYHHANSIPKLIGVFADKDCALNALSKYKTIIEKCGESYVVTEYYLEENVYENGILIDTVDFKFSKMEIEVVTMPDYKIIGVYNNFKEAEQERNRYGNNAFLDFDL